MSSAEFNVGVAAPLKSSSRVLKPPGGGSSIFTGPEVKEQRPRNMKNQQNSTSMNEVMGTVDPNVLISQKVDVPDAPQSQGVQEQFFDSGPEQKTQNSGFEYVDKPRNQASQPQSNGTRGKVPPGGFSAGFW